MDFRRCLLLVFAVAGVTLVQQAQGASLREERRRTLSEKREIVDQKHVELDSNQTENEDRFLTSQLYSDDVRLGRFLRSMLKPKKRTVPGEQKKFTC